MSAASNHANMPPRGGKVSSRGVPVPVSVNRFGAGFPGVRPGGCPLFLCRVRAFGLLCQGTPGNGLDPWARL